MKGLHRTCRCAEVTKEYDRQQSNPDGMGAEEHVTKVVLSLLTFVTVPVSCR